MLAGGLAWRREEKKSYIEEQGFSPSLPSSSFLPPSVDDRRGGPLLLSSVGNRRGAPLLLPSVGDRRGGPRLLPSVDDRRGGPPGGGCGQGQQPQRGQQGPQEGKRPEAGDRLTFHQCI